LITSAPRADALDAVFFDHDDGVGQHFFAISDASETIRLQMKKVLTIDPF
jgi:hypothetical protein